MSYFECAKCKASLRFEYEGDGVYAISPCTCSIKSEPEIITCWYKRDALGDWKTGFFHKWSMNHEEYEYGVGQFPVAIIEDATNRRVHVVEANYVSFSPDTPRGDAE